MSCKSWTCPADFTNPLCTMRASADPGVNSCDICVVPVDPRESAPCGCPPPLLSRTRYYTLDVGGSPYVWPGTGFNLSCPWKAAYGSHRLAGICGAVSSATAIGTTITGTDAEGHLCNFFSPCCSPSGLFAMWTIRANYSPVKVDGLWFRGSTIVDLWDMGSGSLSYPRNIASWIAPARFPACDNEVSHQSTSLTPISVLDGYSLSFLTDHFAITLSI